MMAGDPRRLTPVLGELNSGIPRELSLCPWVSPRGLSAVVKRLSSGRQVIGPGEAAPGKRWMVFSGLTSDVLRHVHHRLN